MNINIYHSILCPYLLPPVFLANPAIFELLIGLPLSFLPTQVDDKPEHRVGNGNVSGPIVEHIQLARRLPDVKFNIVIIMFTSYRL